jgi:Flp pilus assembly pilin Flp
MATKEEVMFGLLLVIISVVLVGAFITYEHLCGRV